MMRLILVLLSIVLLANHSLAQATGTDLRTSQILGGELNKSTQYYVWITCGYDNSIEAYMKRLNGEGEYSSSVRFGATASKIAHFLVFSDDSTPGNTFETFLTQSANVRNHLVFARSNSRSDNLSFDFSKTCNQEFFLFGKDTVYVTPYLSVSTNNTGSNFIAAVLTFGSAAIGAGSNILLGTNILQNDIYFPQLSSLNESYQTFRTALAGNHVSVAPLQLGVGITTIQTSFSTVEIRVSRVPNGYLRGDGIPFLDNASDFLETINLDFAGISQADDVNSNVSNLQSICLEFDKTIKASGIVSEFDRSYLLLKAFAEERPDYINIVRCFVSVGLDDVMVTERFHELVSYRPNLTEFLFDEPALLDYHERWPEELRKVSLPEKITEVLDYEDDITGAVSTFFDYYSYFVADTANQNNYADKTLASSEIERIASNPFQLIDVSGVVFGGRILDENIKNIISSLSSEGYNQFECFFFASEENVKELGTAVFDDASFIMLMHQAPVRTRQNRSEMLFHPNLSILVRGYYDVTTAKISGFSLHYDATNALFENAPNCSNRAMEDAAATELLMSVAPVDTGSE